MGGNIRRLYFSDSTTTKEEPDFKVDNISQSTFLNRYEKKMKGKEFHKDSEKWELLNTVGGNVNQNSHYGNSVELPQNN